MGQGQGRPIQKAAFPSFSAAKPIRLPKDIFITPSAMLFSTAQAAFTFPLWASLWNCPQEKLISPVVSPPNRYTGCPASLNSGESTSPAFTGAMAKEMRVGGTSRSRKEPDMESFPPIAAAP